MPLVLISAEATITVIFIIAATITFTVLPTLNGIESAAVPSDAMMLKVIKRQILFELLMCNELSGPPEAEERCQGGAMVQRIWNSEQNE